MSFNNPAIHILELRELQNSGYIQSYSQKREIRGDYTFSFSLTNQLINGEVVDTSFEDYSIEIVYKKDSFPKVFIRKPVLVKNAIHLHLDSRLCLYHEDNFKWSDKKSIAYDLIPWVYMWVYYYELWLEFGVWYGEEYKH